MDGGRKTHEWSAASEYSPDTYTNASCLTFGKRRLGGVYVGELDGTGSWIGTGLSPPDVTGTVLSPSGCACSSVVVHQFGWDLHPR